MEKFSPEKIHIAASGVKNHQDFVKRVQDRMGMMVLGNSTEKRKPSIYKGGINRILLDREEFHAALVFPSVII